MTACFIQAPQKDLVLHKLNLIFPEESQKGKKGRGGGEREICF